ncbi:MAG: helix-turn-helix domain-containing protein [Candidatus Thioglobus sp.]|jgi:DNA-binding MarR family transcriptional regulator
MNEDKAKIAWRYMTLLKASQEWDSKTKELTGTEFQILAYIGWRGDKAYVSEIVEHPMFRYKSLSTVKRAIGNMKALGLIESKSATKDTRIMYLKLKEK